MACAVAFHADVLMVTLVLDASRLRYGLFLSPLPHLTDLVPLGRNGQRLDPNVNSLIAREAVVEPMQVGAV